MDIQQFMSLLNGAKGGPDQYTARCPAHEDRHNSLSVGRGNDGRILLRCHAGCETAAVLDALGLKTADLFPDANAGHTIKQNTTNRPKTKAKFPPQTAKTNTKTHSSSIPKEGMQNDAMLPDSKRVHESAHGETQMQICKTGEVVYPYTTEEGAPLFETVRIQYSDGSKTFRQRHLDENGKAVYNLKNIKPILYRLPALQEELSSGRGEIFLCEGEKDAEILAGLGLCATTAPMGAGKWREEYSAALSPARQVTLLPDNDRPGRAHALAVAESLAAAGVPCRIADLVALHATGATAEMDASVPAIPGGSIKGASGPLPRKGDVADVVAALGGEAFLAGLDGVCMEPTAFAPLAAARDGEDETPTYRFATAASYMSDGFWRDIERSAAGKGLSTGFAGLDAQLDGRLYGGLYVVGSVSSLGKTAFCLQMADAIAAQGADVLFFTLEMSRLEMVGRSVVRQAFVNSRCTAGYSVGHLLHGRLPKAELSAAARDYHAKYARHIAFIEGGFDLDVAAVSRTAARHQVATGHRPVVFVDYLQILRPPDIRMSDKQATDHNVVELKRLSRRLDLPVVAVSSFNRANYSEEVNMASFKESGAIEYSADFVLGLQARGVSDVSEGCSDERKAARMVSGETKAAKKQDPRPLEAVTLKNRRGPTWAKFELDFYPRQNYFAETGRAPSW